jgi:hypothetical protein
MCRCANACICTCLFKITGMKTKFLRFGFLQFAAMAAIGLLLSCEPEQVGSPILVFVSPSSSQIEANSNDHVFIRIESRSESGSKINLRVESIDPMNGALEVMDSSFNFKKINYLLDYVVPAYPDSTESLLVFTLMNDEGDQIQIAKRIFINKGSSSIKETSGNIMYSTISSDPSAFSLEEMTPAFLKDSLTRELDIIDATSDKNNADGILSRTWVSRTGLQFVKFSGFNYADADAITISNSYKSGIKLSSVNNLKDSDIILVGRGNTAIGAIQILTVTDLAGSANDKYVFSIKKLEE